MQYERVALSNISDDNRQRKDYGDIDALVKSIREFGIIQPIVLQRVPKSDGDGSEKLYLLVAGGRRLEALKRIGTTTIRHGMEFVWRDENLHTPEGSLRLQAVELEENLRRHDLHWSEVIAAKRRLFSLMTKIHGPSRGFGAGRDKSGDGFSLRALASMLGENPSTTSRDLEIAKFVEKHPMIAKLPTKADAVRKLGVAITTAAMAAKAKKSTIVPESTPKPGIGVVLDAAPGSITCAELAPGPLSQDWILYEGRFQDHIQTIASGSVDLICTDLPYNTGLGTSSASHSAGLSGFSDNFFDITQLCHDTAVESYRVLHDDRFAVFFYGMNYHEILSAALRSSGYVVDPYPFIWLRDRTAPPDGFARYSKSYDPAIVAGKETPRFVRPNLPNSLMVPSVRGSERMHAAQKPVAIMEKFILDMTTEGCVVLDMFAGSGTTGEAALRNKRKVILFELESANCLLIKSRLGAL